MYRTFFFFESCILHLYNRILQFNVTEYKQIQALAWCKIMYSWRYKQMAYMLTILSWPQIKAERSIHFSHKSHYYLYIQLWMKHVNITVLYTKKIRRTLNVSRLASWNVPHLFFCQNLFTENQKKNSTFFLFL